MTIRKRLGKKLGILHQLLDREKNLKTRLENVAHLLTGNLLTSVLGLVGFALTARALGPSDYGALALCFTYVGVIERLVSFQSWLPLIKYGAEAQNAGDTEQFQSLLKFGLLLDICAATAGWPIAVALLWIGAPWFGVSPEMSGLVMLYSAVLPFQISGMPTAVLRLFGRFRTIAYGHVATSILRVILCAIGIMVGGGFLEFMLIWMTSQIIGSLTVLGLACAELHRQGLLAGLLSAPLKGVTSKFPGIWRFAISTNISLTIRSSANQVDTLLVGYLADPAAAGLYHIAKRIGRIAQQAGDQLQTVVYPELARAWASKAMAEFRHAIVQTQTLLLGFGLLLTSGLYIAIEPLLRLAAGPDFVAAAPLVVVQSIAVTMTLCGTVIRSALLAMGREDQVLRSVLIATAAFHSTALLLVPVMGAMGANVAHIVMSAIWLSVMMVVYRRPPKQ
ncbi:lipopolysaccharide biosynthesis protein [Ensifer sp. IC3342]|nr:lipopolysaccharide biosynthesis protein [Ensifer sp. BRP08]MCA1448575.1 lipopolysaccharide biosynthesis protein [Ensifer sp. IC3342]